MAATVTLVRGQVESAPRASKGVTSFRLGGEDGRTWPVQIRADIKGRVAKDDVVTVEGDDVDGKLVAAAVITAGGDRIEATPEDTAGEEVKRPSVKALRSADRAVTAPEGVGAVVRVGDLGRMLAMAKQVGWSLSRGLLVDIEERGTMRFRCVGDGVADLRIQAVSVAEPGQLVLPGDRVAAWLRTRDDDATVGVAVSSDAWSVADNSGRIEGDVADVAGVVLPHDLEPSDDAVRLDVGSDGIGLAARVAWAVTTGDPGEMGQVIVCPLGLVATNRGQVTAVQPIPGTEGASAALAPSAARIAALMTGNVQVLVDGDHTWVLDEHCKVRVPTVVPGSLPNALASAYPTNAAGPDEGIAVIVERSAIEHAVRSAMAAVTTSAAAAPRVTVDVDGAIVSVETKGEGRERGVQRCTALTASPEPFKMTVNGEWLTKAFGACGGKTVRLAIKSAKTPALTISPADGGDAFSVLLFKFA